MLTTMSNQRKAGKVQTPPYPSPPPPPEWTPQLRLRLAREEAGLSQSELAERLGLERKAISNWERGEVQFENIRVRWLMEVARELAVTVEWILTGDESQPRPERPTATIHDFPARQVRHRRSAGGEVTTGTTRGYQDDSEPNLCFGDAWAGAPKRKCAA